MSAAADALRDVEAQMALWERRHLRAMWRWRSLRRQRDTLLVMVEREEAQELRQARRWCGSSAVRSE